MATEILTNNYEYTRGDKGSITLEVTVNPSASVLFVTVQPLKSGLQKFDKVPSVSCDVTGFLDEGAIVVGVRPVTLTEDPMATATVAIRLMQNNKSLDGSICDRDGNVVGPIKKNANEAVEFGPYDLGEFVQIGIAA
jgi:hypothetical protein